MSLSTRLAQQDDNGLLQIVKAARIKGKSYMEIERLYGITAPRAESLMREHYKTRAANIDTNEERMLAMERMESLIEPLMDMAQLGNIKSAEVLIKNLEALNTLLGLNLEQTKVEITVINQKQTTVIVDVVDGVTAGLLTYIQAMVTDQTQLALIEDRWDEVVADSYEKKAEELISTELIVSN